MDKTEKISAIIEFIQKVKPLLDDSLIEEYYVVLDDLISILNDEVHLVDKLR